MSCLYSALWLSFSHQDFMRLFVVTSEEIQSCDCTYTHHSQQQQQQQQISPPAPPVRARPLASSPRQLPHKLPQIPLRSILQVLFQRPLVLLAVSPFHAHQQPAVPVQPHQARDQQLVAQLVRLVVVADVFDRVVQQQSVARGPVDHAVEDVRYYFALDREG
jgi:hypothetical protein